MADRTDVFLDVDGVINAVTLSEPAWGWAGMQRIMVNGFQITYSPELVERLNALASRPHVQMHWLTTWLDEAPQVLAAKIGLNGNNWPVLNDPRPAVKFSDYSWWKRHAAIEHYRIHANRIVWIDDDLSDPDSREWAETLGDRIMLVQPDTRVGLTKDMMTQIEEWVGV